MREVRIGGRLDQRLGDRVLAAQFTSSLQRSSDNPGQAMRFLPILEVDYSGLPGNSPIKRISLVE